MKTCAKCGQPRDEAAFYRDRTSADGRESWCKTCRGPNRRHRPGYYHAYDLKRRYGGVTAEQYAQLLADQNGRCRICNTDKPGGRGRFSLDHDHRTGLVRGLLCNRCNRGLGLFLDSPEVLRSAAEYLESVRE